MAMMADGVTAFQILRALVGLGREGIAEDARRVTPDVKPGTIYESLIEVLLGG